MYAAQATVEESANAQANVAVCACDAAAQKEHVFWLLSGWPCVLFGCDAVVLEHISIARAGMDGSACMMIDLAEAKLSKAIAKNATA